MMQPFATLQDLELLFRPLRDDERKKADELLNIVSDFLRATAVRYGKDLDEMNQKNPSFAVTAKVVTVDVVSRILRQNTDGEVLKQESQSALGYSWSGTYAIPGGGVGAAVMKNDLKRLGILGGQQIRGISMYDKD